MALGKSRHTYGSDWSCWMGQQWYCSRLDENIYLSGRLIYSLRNSRSISGAAEEGAYGWGVIRTVKRNAIVSEVKFQEILNSIRHMFHTHTHIYIHTYINWWTECVQLMSWWKNQKIFCLDIDNFALPDRQLMVAQRKYNWNNLLLGSISPSARMYYMI